MQTRGLAPDNSLEPLTAELFVAKVTNDAAAPLYEFKEVFEVAGSWVVKAGGRYGGALNPAVAIPGLALALDDLFLCRAAAGDGNCRWEALAKLPPGSAWKAPVRVASVGNMNLATDFDPLDMMDGVGFVTGNRVLLKDQTAAQENGIYVIGTASPPTRALDADSEDDFVGAIVAVERGTVNAATLWHQTTQRTINVGATPLSWVNVPHNAGGLDNRVARYDGAFTLQPSFAWVDDAGALTVYKTAAPTGSDPFARLEATGTSPRTVTLTLSPAGAAMVNAPTLSATGTSTGGAPFGTVTALELKVPNVPDAGLFRTGGVKMTMDGGTAVGVGGVMWDFTAYDNTTTHHLAAANFVSGQMSTNAAVVYGYTNTGAQWIARSGLTTFGGTWYEYVFGCQDATKNTRIVLSDAGTLVRGIDLTTGPIRTFAGLVTGYPGPVGDVTLAGSQIFTGANTFHPSTDVVPLTIQGGGAGTANLLEAKNAAGATVFSVSPAGVLTGDGSGLTNVALSGAGKAAVAALAGCYAYLF